MRARFFVQTKQEVSNHLCQSGRHPGSLPTFLYSIAPQRVDDRVVCESFLLEGSTANKCRSLFEAGGAVIRYPSNLDFVICDMCGLRIFGLDWDEHICQIADNNHRGAYFSRSRCLGRSDSVPHIESNAVTTPNKCTGVTGGVVGSNLDDLICEMCGLHAFHSNMVVAGNHRAAVTTHCICCNVTDGLVDVQEPILNHCQLSKPDITNNISARKLPEEKVDLPRTSLPFSLECREKVSEHFLNAQKTPLPSGLMDLTVGPTSDLSAVLNDLWDLNPFPIDPQLLESVFFTVLKVYGVFGKGTSLSGGR